MIRGVRTVQSSRPISDGATGGVQCGPRFTVTILRSYLHGALTLWRKLLHAHFVTWLVCLLRAFFHGGDWWVEIPRKVVLFLFILS